MEIKKFTFNPFQENTFVVYDHTKECVIIDAGCYFPEEKEKLFSWIQEMGLQPKYLISTHSHLDHVFGNKAVMDKYKIPLGIHKEDQVTLEALERTASMYNIPNVFASPDPSFYLEAGIDFCFGESSLEIRFVPGHAPGHVVFISHVDGWLINGDCLFSGSIGRTDLPGGNHDLLISKIQEELFTLPDDYLVYCGHGPETTIGIEKSSNPFF